VYSNKIKISNMKLRDWSVSWLFQKTKSNMATDMKK